MTEKGLLSDQSELGEVMGSAGSGRRNFSLEKPGF